jgi:hypothetical protein
MADLTSNQVCNICRINYNAGLRCCALGSALEGGRLFAKQGGFAWIVAPVATQVSRIWTSRNDAVTTAQASAACGDWFVPSRSDLQLGGECKSFWDSPASSFYWSSTEYNALLAWYVAFGTYNNGRVFRTSKTAGPRCVRAFRRVLY